MTVEPDGKHVSEQEAAEAHEPPLAVVPSDDPLPWLTRNPVVAGFLAAILPGVALLGQAVIDGEPVRAILSGIWVAGLGYITHLVRDRVTPLADPKYAPGVPLVVNQQALPPVE